MALAVEPAALCEPLQYAGMRTELKRRADFGRTIMPAIQSIAVFCGSRHGNRPVYEDAARALGSGLAAAGIRLVFGGGKVGLMGVVSDAVLAGGGTVLGVIPTFLKEREVAHTGLTEMVVTETMHARKQRMAQEADAFVTMPGGLGTLDETIEIITWRLLGLHNKPILVCDVDGSSTFFQAAIDGAIAQGFAEPSARDLFEVTRGVPALLARLHALSDERV
jgi:uncharacterized protein (TIGR00730 family)